MMKKKPYIGVTGFTSRDQVTSVLKGMALAEAGRMLMVGVLASSKTLYGGIHQWPNRYPALGDIADIFPDNEHCLNLVHYNTHQRDTLLEQLMEMTELSGSNMHGFQLNIAWPDPDVLHSYRTRHADKTIVLQIGSSAFGRISNTPLYLAGQINRYLGLIDYVLLDSSGGRGLPLNPEVLGGYLAVLQRYKGQIDAVVAGGLGSGTMHLLQSLLREYPNTSFDAEGKLMDEHGRLEVFKARNYIKQALELF